MSYYKIYEQEAAHYMTLNIVFWIDIFTRKRYRDIVIDSLRYCQKERELIIYAWVIMSNHIHLIASCEPGLSNVLRDFKKFTSKKMLASIAQDPESRRKWMLNLFAYAAKKHKRNKEYQVWTHENHPVELYSHEFMLQKVRYIHENPVRAGIVENAEDYLYSSARNYAELDSLLEVERISLFSMKKSY